jgi:hypothetical protein
LPRLLGLNRMIGLDPRAPVLQLGGQHDLRTIHHKKWCDVSRSVGCCSQAPEYRGDLDGPLPGSGFEPVEDILALLGDDAML